MYFEVSIYLYSVNQKYYREAIRLPKKIAFIKFFILNLKFFILNLK